MYAEEFMCWFYEWNMSFEGFRIESQCFGRTEDRYTNKNTSWKGKINGKSYAGSQKIYYALCICI